MSETGGGDGKGGKGSGGGNGAGDENDNTKAGEKGGGAKNNTENDTAGGGGNTKGGGAKNNTENDTAGGGGNTKGGGAKNNTENDTAGGGGNTKDESKNNTKAGRDKDANNTNKYIPYKFPSLYGIQPDMEVCPNIKNATAGGGTTEGEKKKNNFEVYPKQEESSETSEDSSEESSEISSDQNALVVYEEKYTKSWITFLNKYLPDINKFFRDNFPYLKHIYDMSLLEALGITNETNINPRYRDVISDTIFLESHNSNNLQLGEWSKRSGLQQGKWTKELYEKCYNQMLNGSAYFNMSTTIKYFETFEKTQKSENESYKYYISYTTSELRFIFSYSN